MPDNLSSQFFTSQTPQRTSFGDFATGFTMSVLSSIGPEFIGMKPLESAEAFRREEPGWGLASELIGFAVPYEGWFRAIGLASKAGRGIKALRPFARFTSELKNSAAHPILGGIASAALTAAPIEFGRALSKTGFDTADGDPLWGSLNENLTSAALTTAGFGAFGAVSGAFSAMGTKAKPPVPFPQHINQQLSAPQQLRQLKEGLVAGKITPEQGTYWGTRLSTAVREEMPLLKDEKGRSIFIKQVGEEGKSVSVNGLFKTFTGKNSSSRMMSDADLKKSGLEEHLHEVQFPRVRVTKTPEGREKFAKYMQRTMMPVIKDQVWMAREVDDGLFVTTKKIGPDEYAVFKTDNPELIDKSLADYAKSRVNYNNYLFPFNTVEPIGDEYFDFGVNMAKNFQLHNFVDEGPGAGALQKAASAMKLDRGKYSDEKSFQAAVAAQNWVKEYLVPSTHMFTDSARASRIWSLTRVMKDRMHETSQNVLYGKPTTGGKGLMGTIFAPKKPSGPSMESLFEALTPDDIAKYHEFDLKNAFNVLGAEDLKNAFLKGEISEALYKVITVGKAQNDALVKQFNTVARGTDNAELPYLAGHLGLARTWLGNNRVVVFNERGRVAGIVGGRNAREAQGNADDFITRMGGKNWTKSDPVLSSPEQDIQALVRTGMDPAIIRTENNDLAQILAAEGRGATSVRGLMQAKPRTGMGGFIGHTKPATKKELFEIWSKHHQRLSDKIAEMSTKHILAPDINKLSQENATAFTRLMTQVNSLFGHQTEMSAAINRQVDKVMGPILGRNGASKLGAAVNTGMFHLTLGMFNVTYPIMNMMGTIQTVMPQIAFTLKAPMERMAKYYRAAAVAGADGMPRRAVHALDTFRISIEAAKQLGNPEPELLKVVDQLLSRGAIEPRFVEEVLGQKSVTVTRLKDALSKGPENFAEFLNILSQYMPAASERFVRTYSAAAGYKVGKDFFNLAGDDLVDFVEQFIGHGNFLYNSVDRPRLMTGPLGSTFGLFKTWQMNYMAWMMEYLGLGTKHGQWGPMLYMLGGTGAVGGLAAMPTYALADWITQATTDKSLLEFLNSGWFEENPVVGNTLMYGLPASLGISLQGSASAPGAAPLRDASMLFSLAHTDRMRALGEAIGGIWDQATITGEDPLRQTKVRDALIRAFAPRSVQRFVAAAGEQGIKSLHSGYPYVDVPVGDRFLYGMGLNPVRIEKFHDLHAELWSNQNRLRQAVQQFGIAMAEAWVEKDNQASMRIYQSAVAAGVPIDSVMSSAQTRYDKLTTPAFDRSFTPEQASAAMALLGGR